MATHQLLGQVQQLGNVESLALATLLMNRRLPKNFIDIRVLTCASGIHSRTPAFAQRLKEIMNEHGYHSLVVTGYLGAVDISRDWRLKNDDGMAFYS